MKKKRLKTKMTNKNMKSNKAITLIALVITIIVLLILASVSIVTLTGDNGLLTRAEEARDENEVAKERDELGVAFNGAKIDKLGGEVTAEDLNKQFEESNVKAEASGTNPIKIVFEETGNEYEINNGVIKGPGETGGGSGENLELPNTAETKPFLPDGAEVTENDLNKGVTIKDANGNEWVWIEVPKTATVYPTAGLGITNFTEAEYTKIYNDLKIYTADYKSSYTDEWYDGNGKSEGDADANLNDKTGCGLTSAEYKALKNKMLKSVYENGGFYIGKYEVGTDTARFYSNKNELTKPLIQEDKYPYNYVTCSQAQELSQQLATGGRKSSLMFGVQWDLVLKHIETKGGKTQSELDDDSGTWGNYYNAEFPITKGKYSTDYEGTFTEVNGKYTKPKNTEVLLTTGATERNSVLNIYDLAGNVWEWTLEKSSLSDYPPCVYRGGDCFGDGKGSSFPASYRTYYSASGSNSYSAVRPALY